MLRASSQALGETVDLLSVVDGDGVDCGVAGGAALVQFAEVALTDDHKSIRAARQAVVEALGGAAMVDAAAVIANFQRMVRIADGTGIPLDEPVLMVSQGIRKDLGLDSFEGAANSKPLTFLKRVVGKNVSAGRVEGACSPSSLHEYEG